MHMNMPGMQSAAEDPEEQTCLLIGYLPMWSEGSGTSRLPGVEGTVGGDTQCFSASSPHHPGGLHIMAGDWMLMLHGYVSAQYTKSTGPRGDDKLFATSMAMLMAERQTSFGRVQFKSMLSLEPAMDSSGYPNLFGSGETAGGKPLVDRQHPHDLFMKLSARVDFNLGQNASLFLNGGPVGEPALGPSALMHRASARYNPEPPITHHWFDSTHITYGVATVGLATPHLSSKARSSPGASRTSGAGISRSSGLTAGQCGRRGTPRQGGRCKPATVS